MLVASNAVSMLVIVWAFTTRLEHRITKLETLVNVIMHRAHASRHDDEDE